MYVMHNAVSKIDNMFNDAEFIENISSHILKVKIITTCLSPSDLAKFSCFMQAEKFSKSRFSMSVFKIYIIQGLIRIIT